MIQKLPFEACRFKAMKGHLLLKVLSSDSVEVSKSGIVIGKKSVLDRPCWGEVMSSGVDNIIEGDVVVFPNTDGIDCEFNEHTGYMLLKGDSVIGIIKK